MKTNPHAKKYKAAVRIYNNKWEQIHELAVVVEADFFNRITAEGRQVCKNIALNAMEQIEKGSKKPRISTKKPSSKAEEELNLSKYYYEII